MVIISQVVLPLVLLIWMALWPARGWLAWGLQLGSVTAVLLGLRLAALWTMPPFWVPHVYGLVLALVVLAHLVRKGIPGPGLWRVSAGGSVILLVVSGLGGFGGYLAWQAAKGRVPPQGDIVNIAPPFPPGHYLVAHGGSTSMVNVHLKTLNESVERFRPWRGQSKALDIFRIHPMGFHRTDWHPDNPAGYTTFGTPVLAPCQGKVALVVDGLEDQPVPVMDRDHMAGNHVAVDCGEFFVILAHLRQGSIGVATGDEVAIGELLGQMGNSGNSSEPHLHLHAQKALPEETPLSGEPLWLTINNRFLVRNDTLHLSRQEQGRGTGPD
ncbi:M23 family metallopeptidase [Marinobacter sp.]|uniref:M23 family metallopeptidase n=1 Tax=Marinobacter sp. TaxID=50741 RepID=UPI003567C494